MPHLFSQSCQVNGDANYCTIYLAGILRSELAMFWVCIIHMIVLSLTAINYALIVKAVSVFLCFITNESNINLDCWPFIVVGG